MGNKCTIDGYKSSDFKHGVIELDDKSDSIEYTMDIQRSDYMTVITVETAWGDIKFKTKCELVFSKILMEYTEGDSTVTVSAPMDFSSIPYKEFTFKSTMLGADVKLDNETVGLMYMNRDYIHVSIDRYMEKYKCCSLVSRLIAVGAISAFHHGIGKEVL